MKHKVDHEIKEIPVYRFPDSHAEQIKDINTNIDHLAGTIAGLLLRLKDLESKAKQQEDTNSKIAACIEIVADELDLIIIDETEVEA